MALRQNRQVVMSVDALSLKDVQLILIFLYYAWPIILIDRLSNLFIFLCDTFPTVLSARCY